MSSSSSLSSKTMDDKKDNTTTTKVHGDEEREQEGSKGCDGGHATKEHDCKKADDDIEKEEEAGGKVEEEASLDIRACCLCHSALDYSDRAAFFEADRHEDYSKNNNKGGSDDGDNSSSSSSEYFYRPDDPYLPVSLYDKNNALVYCDSCDRLYHQRCHFVPLTILPKGQFICLLCQSQTPQKKPQKKKKKDNKQQTKSNHNQQQQLAVLKVPPDAFQSPPIPAARASEIAWEEQSRMHKAAGWKKELTVRSKSAIQVQLSNSRMAVTALETLTSTRKNREHFSSNSQELAQTLVKLYSSKLKIREFLLNLEEIRKRDKDEEQWRILLEWTRKHEQQKNEKNNTGNDDGDGEDFVKRVLFPFGRNYERRWDPRTPERKLAIAEAAAAAAAQSTKGSSGETVPGVVRIVADQKPCATDKEEHNGSQARSPTSTHKNACRMTTRSRNKKKSKAKDADEGNDDDAVSLDDLRCCVCHANHSSDDNDMIMCDGEACFRAYHCQCLSPAVSPQELEKDAWFCPICNAVADLTLFVQTEYMGDDWERRRYEAAAAKEAAKSPRRRHQHDADDDSSLKSWENVHDVFPEAAEEYETACQLRDGVRNEATEELLACILGTDGVPMAEDEDDDDNDDVEEDGHFDLDSYQEERRLQREEERGSEDDEESSHSSQATLVDMSSVEYQIGNDELAALSEGEGAENSEGEGEEGGGGGGEGPVVRRSRRIRNQDSSPGDNHPAAPKSSDPGKLDEANILRGKRGRKPVDYIRLNDLIFGDLSDSEIANLDDKEDFKVSRKKKKKTTKKAPHTNHDDSDEGEDEESRGADDDSQAAKHKDTAATQPVKKNAGSAKQKSKDSATATKKGGNNANKAEGRQGPSQKVGVRKSKETKDNQHNISSIGRSKNRTRKRDTQQPSNRDEEKQSSKRTKKHGDAAESDSKSNGSKSNGTTPSKRAAKDGTKAKAGAGGKKKKVDAVKNSPVHKNNESASSVVSYAKKDTAKVAANNVKRARKNKTTGATESSVEARATVDVTKVAKRKKPHKNGRSPEIAKRKASAVLVKQHGPDVDRGINGGSKTGSRRKRTSSKADDSE